MSLVIEGLKLSYKKGKITVSSLSDMKNKGQITEEEFNYIIGKA